MHALTVQFERLLGQPPRLGLSAMTECRPGFTSTKPPKPCKAGRSFNTETPSREEVQPQMNTDEHGLNSPRNNLRACFKNRAIRGPGLQWGQNRHVSRRPRALTRRFRGFLKHALRNSSGAESRRQFQEFARSLIDAPTEQWKLAQDCPESLRRYPGKPSRTIIPPRLLERGESDATLAHRMGEGLGVRASAEESKIP